MNLKERALARGIDLGYYRLPEDNDRLEQDILKTKPKARKGHIDVLKGLVQLQKDGPNMALIDKEGNVLTSQPMSELRRGPIEDSFDYMNYKFSYTMSHVDKEHYHIKFA